MKIIGGRKRKGRDKRRSIPPLLACHDKFTTFTFSHKNTIKKLIKVKEERRGRREKRDREKYLSSTGPIKNLQLIQLSTVTEEEKSQTKISQSYITILIYIHFCNRI